MTPTEPVNQGTIGNSVSHGSLRAASMLMAINALMDLRDRPAVYIDHSRETRRAREGSSGVLHVVDPQKHPSANKGSLEGHSSKKARRALLKKMLKRK